MKIKLVRMFTCLLFLEMVINPVFGMEQDLRFWRNGSVTASGVLPPQGVSTTGRVPAPHYGRTSTLGASGASSITHGSGASRDPWVGDAMEPHIGMRREFQIASRESLRSQENPTSRGIGATVLAPPHRNDEFDLDPLLRNIQETERQVQMRIQRARDNPTKVLIVGTTGSGKSTLVHGLARRQLEAYSEKGRRVITVAETNLLEGFTIGHGLGSETQIPNVWYDESNNLLYCDCPGFMDSRGPKQVLVNAFAIDQLFTLPSRIKILLALQESDFEGARGMEAIACLNKLRTLVPDISHLKQALSLVVTKGSGAYSPREKVEGLLLDAREEQEKRSRAGRETHDLDAPIDLLDSLIRKPNQIFSFLSPRNDGPYTLFEDRRGIVESLRRDYAINIKHLLCLDESVLYEILRRIEKLGNIQRFAGELSEAMQANYRSDPRTLRQWHNFSTSMLGNRENEKFMSELERFLPSHVRAFGQFSTLLHNLKSSQRYIDFARHVAKGNGRELPIPDLSQLLMPSLKNMKAELENLMSHEALFRKQAQDEESLKHQLTRAMKDRQLTREEGDRQLRSLQTKALQERSQLERQLEVYRAQQQSEAARITAQLESQKVSFAQQMETMRRQQLPDLESQIVSLRAQLSNALARAENAEARLQGMGGGQQQYNPFELYNPWAGPVGYTHPY